MTTTKRLLTIWTAALVAMGVAHAGTISSGGFTSTSTQVLRCVAETDGHESLRLYVMHEATDDSNTLYLDQVIGETEEAILAPVTVTLNFRQFGGLVLRGAGVELYLPRLKGQSDRFSGELRTEIKRALPPTLKCEWN